jgi:pyruvate dehydrogenase E2 component (dihydrolipoamide acetyltransferase)
MATKVHMEALSPTMEEGQLVRWLKHEGDAVNEGDILAEIETDKATMELVARGSGVLQGISIKEGETAPVGQQIATIAAAGEAVAAPAAKAAETGAPKSADATAAKQDAAKAEPAAPAKTEAAPAAQKTAAAPATATAAPAITPVAQAAVDNTDADTNGRVRVSPLARRLASEAGLDLAEVEGTGPGGRITKKDIEAAVQSGPKPAKAATAGAGAAAPASGAPAAARPPQPVRRDGVDSEEFPITQMRKTIAKRLVTSIGPVPTFYLTRDIDMTRVMEARERVNARLEKQGVKVSVNDIIIKAVASALVRHPEVNASWGENAITRHYRAHIGVAVAVEDGLITPIVRDADSKPVSAIAAEVREMAGRAREKKLKPEEYTGATFSISNLGMFGIEEFTAIINPPEAAILAVGAVEDRVVAVDGQPVVQPRMRITMSCDHRVIDGASGARFLQTLADFLEEPLMILV